MTFYTCASVKLKTIKTDVVLVYEQYFISFVSSSIFKVRQARTQRGGTVSFIPTESH